MATVRTNSVRQTQGSRIRKKSAAPAKDAGVLAGRTLTDFESRLYKACRCIPEGKVATYGLLAAVLGNPKASRAVGQGMRHNKFPPYVPCHRVVASDLGLGGFSGAWGGWCSEVQRKRKMLLEEGVKLEGDKIAKESVASLEELAQLYKAAPEFAPPDTKS